MSSDDLPRLVRRLLEAEEGPVLVVHGATAPAIPGSRHVLVPAGGAAPKEARHPAALLAFADAAEARRAASVIGPVGRSRRLLIWLASADRPPVFVPPPVLPALRSVRAELTPNGEAVLELRFVRPPKVEEVLSAVARQLDPGAAAPPAPARPVLGVLAGEPAEVLRGAPPADPAYQVLTAGELASADETVVPVDVLLAPEVPPHLPEQSVTGRAPVVVTDPVLRAGPLDEGLLNPVGFVKRPSARVVDLATLMGGRADPPLPALVHAAHDHAGVRVDWSHAPLPELARTVAALAMAGVPLLPAPPEAAPPAAARRLLGDPLAALLQPNTSAANDLDDPLRREEHSVRLRRAAHAHHASWAWRRRVAEAAGLPGPTEPTVSVLLATKRPERLGHALRQVARQRGVSVQLVLAAHGHRPDPDMVRSQVPEAVVLSLPAETVFGDVLQTAVRAASGDLLLKMDDDDWYGPDFIADLVLARRWSGADVVGTTAEYVYLEDLDRTVRRDNESETWARFVAGGTIMTSRALMDEVGGFRPVRRFVDAQLLTAALSAGASIYRAQGLGYVLRRAEAGHTWETGSEFFLDPARLDQQWDGFVPSRLLEHDPRDLVPDA